MGRDNDSLKGKEKVTNTSKAGATHATFSWQCQCQVLSRALHKDIPRDRGGALLPRVTWQHSTPPENCTDSVFVILLQGFTGPGGARLSWKGLAGAISRQGSHSKIFLALVRTHQSVAFRVCDTKAIINDLVQSKRTAVSVTFYSCLKSLKFF